MSEHFTVGAGIVSVRRVPHFKQDRNAGLCRFSTPELKYNNTRPDPIGPDRRLGGKQSERARRVQDRLSFIRSLQPTRIFHSTRGFVGYIVVEFCDKMTVFKRPSEWGPPSE